MSASILRPIALPPTLAGQPAPCDLFDERGILLLREGHPVRAGLIAPQASRRLYCHAAQAPRSAQQSPLRILRDVAETLELIEALTGDGQVLDAGVLIELASACTSAWRFDPDACIGYARLALTDHPCVAQLVLAALFSAELGHAHGLPQENIRNLVGAALSMNLGSLALHRHLHGRSSPPDEHARRALQAHPTLACTLLAELDGLPPEWLQAVASHHENLDGSGYPAGLQRSEIPLGARILRVADVLAARLLGSRERAAHYWNIARTGSPEAFIEHVFGDDLVRIDRHLARLLATRLGSFPPGSLVRLSTGELALINRRSTRNASPREALSLLDARGRRHPVPRPRPLGARECRIQGYAHDEQFRHLPDYDWPQLWGYEEHPAAGAQLH